MTQAQRIFAKFGGAYRLYLALSDLAEHTGDPSKKRSKTTVYRWDYPAAKRGCGGVIPSAALADVLAAAELKGIAITADDLDPRPRGEPDIFG